MTGPASGGWLGRQRVPVTRFRILDARAEARLALAYTCAYVLLAAVISWCIRLHPRPIWGAARFNQDVLYALVLKIGFLLVIPVLVLRRLGYRAADFVPERGRVAGRLRLPVAFLLGAAVNAGHIAPIRAALPAFTPAEAAGRLLLGLVMPLFTAGLPEEIVYRGFLQTRLEAVRGRPVAILGTALLFTAWHLPSRYLLSRGGEGQAGDAVSILFGTGLPVFIVALILGWAWDRYRDLPVLIAVHWGVDSLPTMSSMLGIWL